MGKKTLVPIHSSIIGESAATVNGLYLLIGTMLYTDGAPTSDVEGAIQVVDTDKYKIKVNALINIANATYVNISN